MYAVLLEQVFGNLFNKEYMGVNITEYRFSWSVIFWHLGFASASAREL
jgi:hypothetical protein